jgi:hypothetical protein
MPLPPKYRIIMRNSTGQTIDHTTGTPIFSLDVVGYQYSSGQQATNNRIAGEDTLNGGSLADGGDIASASIDNTTHKDVSAVVILWMTHDNSSADGTVDVFVDKRDAGDSFWTTDSSDADLDEDCEYIGSLNFGGTEERGPVHLPFG